MLKSIFTQILNRKRSNSWIVAELSLVFILAWNITDYFFVIGYNYSIPNYRDIRHTWQVNLAEYPDVHPLYRSEENAGKALEANFSRILQTIRNYPDIEAISISERGSEPGSGGYHVRGFYSLNDTSHYENGQAIRLDPQSDFFRVFGYTTNNGKTPVSTSDFDWSNPNGIVIGHSVAKRLFPDGLATGKELTDGNKTQNYVVLGIVDDIKRFDYERTQNTFYLAFRCDSSNLRNVKISIRSKTSIPDASFKEAFKKEMTNSLQIGNFYLKSIVSYGKIATDTKNSFGMTNEIRQRTYLMIFFLLNILLCVMGTFWYRIHTRREETGIRKAMGSTNRNIRNIFLIEGLCLLTIAMLPAMIVEANLVYAGLIETLGRENLDTTYLPDRIFLRFLITNGITWVIMSAVIIAAIWLPARKAAAMPPAEALHYE
ncbi:MAG: ABC transporter permease [Dysgonamonadaceae bacterium]|jgi:ABC-type antimicrobial peptide transport system permease subunit|nr:ABC transporter permease [Dysgonamonadaceae bacterium]